MFVHLLLRRKLAVRKFEHLGDKSISVEQQARRKRALIRGPKEFRDIHGAGNPKMSKAVR